jgi:predicted nuclease of restriction endonuclease-like (RecB) superfamily
MDVIKKNNDYQHLVNQISKMYLHGQKKAVVAINKYHLDTYWQIGQYIVEFEQGGKAKAEYGKGLIENLSKDLSVLHGKGFSLSNLKRMRQFYLIYPISAKPSHLLNWSHYVELLKIDDELERSFYEKQSLLENWSIPELIRQKKSSLFLRLAASKDKEGIQKLAKQGQIVEQPIDLIREPCVLEFLQVPEPYHFIGRQYRITLGNRHYYVDMVFYHRILKCFVLIDLKKEEAGYEDVGQMNMYLGYFENEENTEGDNPPIGIVLAREKDELLVKYAMHNISSQLFVSKYQLYLPKREELRALIERQLNLSDDNV